MPSPTDKVDRTADSPAMAPKKRARPPKAPDAEPEEEHPAETRPRKRKKAAEGGAGAGQEQDKPEEQASTMAARPRGRKTQQAGAMAAEASQSEPRVGKQKEKAKGRPGSKPANRGEQPAEDQNTDETTARRSRRERRSADDNPWWNAAQTSSEAAGSSSKQTSAPPKPKRSRASLAEMSVSKAQNQPAPSPAEQGKKKGRGRPSRPSNEASTEPPAPKPKPAKKQQQPPASPSDNPPSPPPAPYRHLATHTHHIPRATITSKWHPLPATTLPTISALLADASRPVLHRLPAHTARHAHAQTVLRTFASGLRSRLARGMPFPPATLPASSSGKTRKSETAGGGYAVELDFEKIVDGIASLEAVLEPLMHSVVLLRGEKEREERELEREYAVLRRLEGDARAQVREWREGWGKGRGHGLAGIASAPAESTGSGGREVVGVKGGGGVFTVSFSPFSFF